jgi:hypothetical protein
LQSSDAGDAYQDDGCRHHYDGRESAPAHRRDAPWAIVDGSLSQLVSIAVDDRRRKIVAVSTPRQVPLLSQGVQCSRPIGPGKLDCSFEIRPSLALRCPVCVQFVPDDSLLALGHVNQFAILELCLGLNVVLGLVGLGSELVELCAQLSQSSLDSSYFLTWGFHGFSPSIYV